MSEEREETQRKLGHEASALFVLLLTLGSVCPHSLAVRQLWGFLILSSTKDKES